MNEGKDQRARAYGAGARIARERIRKEAPEDAATLEQIEASDILVVPGSYDRVEEVLDLLELPHTRVRAGDLAAARLRPQQLVVVNCPGHLPPRALAAVRDFVARGGSLFTTDWSLLHVLEPAFGGLVSYSHRPTADDVVRIEVRRADNPFLRGVMDGADEPVWWLEGSSYPIRIDDPARVEVLIQSRELGERYGEAPVAILFRHGEGEVFHMISHYYLQRTELRSERQAAPASAYVAEKGVALAMDLDGLALGDVESAQTSARFLANIVAKKKKGVQR